MDLDPEADLRDEMVAAGLVQVNNCLINAILDAAGMDEASFEQLVEIGSELNNVGQMLVASDEVIGLIRHVFGITNAISVFDQGEDLPESFPGSDPEIVILNTGHFHSGSGAPDM